jgi:hypothetical protein
MGKYNFKSFDAFTFDELVEYGKTNGANIVNDMPWSFNFRGYPMTHENDECYLVPLLDGNTIRFGPNEMLVFRFNPSLGRENVYTMNKIEFFKFFEEVKYL